MTKQKATQKTIQEMANVLEKRNGFKEADKFINKVVKQPKVKKEN